MENVKSRYPTNPTEYVRSDHFLDALEDSSRVFPLKGAMNAIRHGELETADGNAEVEWVIDKHGVKIYVLCGYVHGKEVPVLITGWASVHDPRQAVKSGQWSEAQLRTMHQFSDANGRLEDAFDYP